MLGLARVGSLSAGVEAWTDVFGFRSVDAQRPEAEAYSTSRTGSPSMDARQEVVSLGWLPEP